MLVELEDLPVVSTEAVLDQVEARLAGQQKLVGHLVLAGVWTGVEEAVAPVVLDPAVLEALELSTTGVGGLEMLVSSDQRRSLEDSSSSSDERASWRTTCPPVCKLFHPGWPALPSVVWSEKHASCVRLTRMSWRLSRSAAGVG